MWLWTLSCGQATQACVYAQPPILTFWQSLTRGAVAMPPWLTYLHVGLSLASRHAAEQLQQAGVLMPCANDLKSPGCFAWLHSACLCHVLSNSKHT